MPAKAIPVSLTCPVCQRTFDVLPCEARKGRRFCSHTCSQIAHARCVELVCPVCHVKFSVRFDKNRQGRRRFCSKACSSRGNRKRTHGATAGGQMAPEYRVWRWMRSRCLNPNNGDYHHYGGRGIRVCAEWLNDFAQFLADVGPRPSPKHEIDRIDVNGDYEKSNVRWTDRSGQMNNTRCNRRITFQGRTQTLTEWGRELGISPKTLRYRLLAAGWPVERAFGRPVGRWVKEDGTPPVPHDPETGRFATEKARPTPDPPKAPQLCLDL